jgi:spermidine synthase
MGGLGWGSLAGGYAADRLSARGSLLAFALAELAIAVFAVSSKWLYYDQLYLRFGHLIESRIATGITLFSSLLWPTFFMGMSLPLLSRALTRRLESAPRVVGALYGVNTLGAAAGALLTTWFLIRAMGLDGSLDAGAVANAFCAAGGLVLFWRAKLGAGVEGVSGPPTEPSSGAGPLRFPTWAIIYALSGFLALSLEIVWFRLLGVMMKSTSFTFGTLVGTYLACLGAGTLAGVAWAPRCRNPARAFFALQSGVTLYAGFALAMLVNRVDDWPALRTLWIYLGSYDPVRLSQILSPLDALTFGGRGAPTPLASLDRLGLFGLLYLALPLALIGPPTLLMGMSFPLLQKVVQTEEAELGRRVGWLQTANIVGSMLGAVLTGCLLLRLAGTAGSLRALVVLGTLYLFWWSGRVSKRRTAFRAGAVVVALAVLGLMPGGTRLWSKLHGTIPSRILVAEDETGVSLIRNQSAHFPEGILVRSAVFANGLGQSTLPYGGTHRHLGLVPSLLHPSPQDIAIIGLGSGNTLFFAGGRPETRSLTCIEIIAPQLRTLVLRNEKQRYGALDAVLNDPRIRFVFTDGRTFVLRGEKRYDVIEADALRPTSAYSGNLYSYEFFRSIAGRLKPGGFAVSWAPTERVVRTFTTAFPHVVHYDALGILIGSPDPIDVDVERARARTRHPFTVAYYRNANVDLEALVDDTIARRPPVVVRFGPKRLEDINTDLYPRDEYMVPARRPR